MLVRSDMLWNMSSVKVNRGEYNWKVPRELLEQDTSRPEPDDAGGGVRPGAANIFIFYILCYEFKIT